MKKLFINIVVIIILAILFELTCFFIWCHKNGRQLDLQNEMAVERKFEYNLPSDYLSSYFTDGFKNYTYPDNNKRPILLLGCSYARGIGINEEKGLDYLLYKNSHRDVYKRAFPGGGIHLALDLFQTGYMQKDVPDAEYIIFVYVNWNLIRLYEHQLDFLSTEINQRYELQKNGQLKKIKKPIFPFCYSLFSVKLLQRQIDNYRAQNEYTNYRLFNAVMKELKKETDKAYKNSKFVILLYPSSDYMGTNKELMEQEEMQKLTDEGFIVINAEDLTDKPIREAEYRQGDKNHPKKKAWEAITPGLIKVLNL